MIDITPIIPPMNQNIERTQITDKDKHNRNRQEKKDHQSDEEVHDILPENMQEENNKEDQKRKTDSIPYSSLDIEA